MSEFEIVSVKTANHLHDNLEKLLKNKKHIDSIVVDSISDRIKIDLSRTANTFGNPDFQMKLKRGRAAEAEVIINRLRSQNSPSRQQSEELFALLDVN